MTVNRRRRYVTFARPPPLFGGDVYCRLFCQVVYYESMNREVKTRPMYEYRDDERLKPKAEESTILAYTGLLGTLCSQLK
jgi:hypothetical protein